VTATGQWSRAAVAAAGATVLAVLLSAAPVDGRAPVEEQWYLDRIGIPAAHAISRGDGVVIGAFNTGLPALNHPDLRDQYLPGANFEPRGRQVPVDAGAQRDPSLQRESADALMVSRGETGLIGVAPGARITPVTGTATGGAQLRWLVGQGVRVINYYRPIVTHVRDESADEADALRYALARDVVVIVDQTSAAEARWATTGLVVVGAVDRDDKRVRASSLRPTTNKLPPVSVVAPDPSGRLARPLPSGKQPEDYWDRLYPDPEEAATAIVAGVAALIRAKYPDLNAASVIDRILRTAEDAGPPGREDDYGHGVVDAAAALAPGIPAVAANPLGDPGPPRGDGGAEKRDSALERATLWAAQIAIVVLAVGGVVTVLLVLRTRRRRRARLTTRLPG
jgi:membrane-anchored mycosin MYCP